MLKPVTKLGEDAYITIVDASEYCAAGEVLNFWQLVVRTQAQRDVLLGFYAIPEGLDEPLEAVVDPLGMEVSAPQ